MRVSDVLSVKGASIVSVRADQPLVAAIKLMASRNVGSVIVLDLSSRPLGIVSEPDVVATINNLGPECLHQDTRLAMRAPTPKCAPDQTVGAALARMTRERVRYLLVVDGENLRGPVSIGDLVKARLESTELEARVLRDMACGKLLAGA